VSLTVYFIRLNINVYGLKIKHYENIIVITHNPLINITKIPNPLNLPLGPGSVTYTYTVTNIGKVAMGDIFVKDDKCSPVNYVSGDIYSNC
jgi:uncharacterized repeat protein (TIGR01451 family)